MPARRSARDGSGNRIDRAPRGNPLIVLVRGGDKDNQAKETALAPATAGRAAAGGAGPKPRSATPLPSWPAGAPPMTEEPGGDAGGGAAETGPLRAKRDFPGRGDQGAGARIAAGRLAG